MFTGEVCKKCDQGRMVGPTYSKRFKAGLPGGWEEFLNYRCSICGYVESESVKPSFRL